MLIRIVHMSFDPDRVEEFLEFFKSINQQVRTFPGCQKLILLQDLHTPSKFTTYSQWDNEQALETYRQSELFGKVWKNTKALFNDRPAAASYMEKIVVEPGL